MYRYSALFTVPYVLRQTWTTFDCVKSVDKTVLMLIRKMTLHSKIYTICILFAMIYTGNLHDIYILLSIKEPNDHIRSLSELFRPLSGQG